MIIVDTSIWVTFFRGRDTAAVAEVQRLIDEDVVGLAIPVRIELLAGVRRQDQARLRRLLGALPPLRPVDATWDRMEEWALLGGVAGQHFGVGDLLVAALAAERGAPVWSADGDFERMQELGFIELHDPG